MKRASKSLLHSSLSLSSKLFSSSKPLTPTKPFSPVRPLFSSTTKAAVKTGKETASPPRPKRNSLILEKFRQRQLKGSQKSGPRSIEESPPPASAVEKANGSDSCEEVGIGNEKKGAPEVVSGFQELGLKEEITGALGEAGIFVPSEIHCVGIPALLDGKSVLLSCDSGPERVLAYLLPLIQLLRQDNALLNVRPKHPRAIVLCPSEELCHQSFEIAKFINHHARLKSTLKSGSEKSTSEPDVPIGMVVGTPSEIIEQIEDGRVVLSNIKYLVLDEVDSMFDHGFSPEIHKILSPLKNCESQANSQALQTVLVTSSVIKMLGKHLSPLMEHLEQSHAGKVAAMLLEMDQTEVFQLTESLDALKKKVVEAMDSLHSD